MHLPHKTPHCAGRWQPYDPHFWRCDTCGALADNSARMLGTIAQDNFVARLVRELEQSDHNSPHQNNVH